MQEAEVLSSHQPEEGPSVESEAEADPSLWEVVAVPKSVVPEVDPSLQGAVALGLEVAVVDPLLRMARAVPERLEAEADPSLMATEVVAASVQTFFL